MKLTTFLAVGLLVFGYAVTANAGAVPDADGDLVPDAFDNCINVDNGPNTIPANAQVDLDGDGFGVACDADYNQDGSVGVGDFQVFFDAFTGAAPEPRADHNQDGSVGTGDFSNFFFPQFQAGVPGPSCCAP